MSQGLSSCQPGPVPSTNALGSALDSSAPGSAAEKITSKTNAIVTPARDAHLIGAAFAEGELVLVGWVSEAQPTTRAVDRWVALRLPTLQRGYNSLHKAISVP